MCYHQCHIDNAAAKEDACRGDMRGEDSQNHFATVLAKVAA